MESEFRPEQSKHAFLRVELDEEHKRFTKQCETADCTVEFTTSVPRKFFENPDDVSTELDVNGEGMIAGTSILAADVTHHIFNREFTHTHNSSSLETDV